ncbi:MAG: hypothetical protein KDA89_14675 [Planctomycetaceae bacterium]|nr:hypothetical protein [Planctomycetaceae bacterium]
MPTFVRCVRGVRIGAESLSGDVMFVARVSGSVLSQGLCPCHVLLTAAGPSRIAATWGDFELSEFAGVMLAVVWKD